MSTVSFSSTASQAGAQTSVTAYGLQNVFINTKRPQTTLWHVDHTPMTHFAYADMAVSFNGAVNFGSRVQAEIDRNGDLISEVNLRFALRPWLEGANVADTFDEAVIDNNYFYTDDFGNACIGLCELLVGSSRLDVADGTYFHLYDEKIGRAHV